METKPEAHVAQVRRPAPLRWLLSHLRRRWQVYVGLAISAFFLYQILSRMWSQVGQVWDQLKGAHYLWVIPGVAVYFFGVWARTWRWHYMLRPVQRVPLGRLFPVVCIGYMGNNIYPYRAGEVLRAYVLRQKEGVSISASLATILAERVFDGIIMLLFVFLGLPFFPGIPEDWRRWVIVFTLAFFGALGLFFLVAASPRRTEALYTWLIERVVPRRLRAPVQGVAERFVAGLRCLRSPRDLGMILITSCVIWLAETVKYWFVMHAFAFAVPFYILMLMNGVVNLFTTLPAGPGYIGTFDWPGIEVLTAYMSQGAGPRAIGRRTGQVLWALFQGTPARFPPDPTMAVSTAYTFALHVALWFPITALGAFYMLRLGRGLDWRRARQEVAAEKEQAP